MVIEKNFSLFISEESLFFFFHLNNEKQIKSTSGIENYSSKTQNFCSLADYTKVKK